MKRGRFANPQRTGAILRKPLTIRQHNGTGIAELLRKMGVREILQNFMGQNLAFKKRIAHFCETQAPTLRLTFSMIRSGNGLVILLLVLSPPV
jgi:hypothetical protein